MNSAGLDSDGIGVKVGVPGFLRKRNRLSIHQKHFIPNLDNLPTQSYNALYIGHMPVSRRSDNYDVSLPDIPNAR